MADVQKYLSKYRATVQKAVPEPIETVGLLSVKGSAVSGALMLASPLASMATGRSARKAAGGLPKDLVIGVGASSLFLFGYKPKGVNIKLKGDAIVWPRQGVRFARSGPGAASSVVAELTESGERIELEQPMWFGGDINADFFRAVGSEPG